MKWPWQHQRNDSRLAVLSEPDRFAYALADGRGQLRAAAVLLRAGATPQDMGRRVRALHLPLHGALAVLPLGDAQLLSVEAPAVQPEELKAAVRWRIKDLVDTRLDELTIDVLSVGDDRPRPQRNVFVAAARTVLIRELGDRLQTAGLELAVIDLVEMSQRNLQCALARAAGLGDRATAALVRHGAQCLLTICAGDELFYARRLDWEDLPQRSLVPALAVSAEAPLQSMDFVDYGATDKDSGDHDDGAPRLVVELQRSFDVWERSWPDLPLATLWVQVGAATAELMPQLQATLGRPVHELDADSLFPGFTALAPTVAQRETLLPLLGALLRSETRKA